jgi:RDD family
VDQPLERSAFAGFSSRVAAGLIDWLIVFAALWIAVIIQAVVGFDSPVSVVLSLATLLLPVLYFGLFWSRDGQTLGMRTTNIQMVDTRTWDPASWMRASSADSPPSSRSSPAGSRSSQPSATGQVRHWSLRSPCRSPRSR